MGNLEGRRVRGRKRDIFISNDAEAPLNYLAVARIEPTGSFSALRGLLTTFARRLKPIECWHTIVESLEDDFPRSELFIWVFYNSTLPHKQAPPPAEFNLQEARHKKFTTISRTINSKTSAVSPTLPRMAWIMNDSFTMNHHEKSPCSGVAPDSHRNVYLLVKHFSFRP